MPNLGWQTCTLVKVVNAMDVVVKHNARTAPRYLKIKRNSLSYNKLILKFMIFMCILNKEHFQQIKQLPNVVPWRVHTLRCWTEYSTIVTKLMEESYVQVLCQVQLHKGCLLANLLQKAYMQLCVRGTGGNECALIPIDSAEDA